jgi:hypothetical protein
VKTKHKANKIKQWRLCAVIWLALSIFKVCVQFFTQRIESPELLKVKFEKRKLVGVAEIK